jgi:hypothetical protein
LIGKRSKQSITIEQAVRPYKKRDKKNKLGLELYSNPFEENIDKVSSILN